ncbi:9953_t:CDS:1 [Paraglomus occultum]|uniref:9953_t:CDS:1 n=1 Tax=Paraglomus occultum TaxID=144539 RepID=A0A9N9D5K4_9GLOM|nr:9953_t:CDS:1 [Paraglomus occultum]
MASGPVGGGPRMRSIWRFLAVDPEIYPLLGVLMATFGAAGYMLGKNAATVRNDDAKRLMSERPIPFRVDARSNIPGVSPSGNFRYSYHRSREDNAAQVPPPSAVTEHEVKVNVPEEVAEKVSAAAKTD